ncbi:MAG: hypothetical protein QM689_06325 [Oscillospiraceae bacterium]
MERKDARAGAFRLELVARLGIAVSLVNFVFAAFSVNVTGMFFQMIFLIGFFLVREGRGTARLVLAVTSAVMLPFLVLDLISLMKTAQTLTASEAVSAALSLAVDGFYVYALWALVMDKKIRLFFRAAAGKTTVAEMERKSGKKKST